MKTNIVLVVIGLIGVGCAVAFNRFGAAVDSESVLQASFYLIPLAYILMLIGFGGLLLLRAIRRMRRD